MQLQSQKKRTLGKGRRSLGLENRRIRCKLGNITIVWWIEKWRTEKMLSGSKVGAKWNKRSTRKRDSSAKKRESNGWEQGQYNQREHWAWVSDRKIRNEDNVARKRDERARKRNSRVSVRDICGSMWDSRDCVRDDRISQKKTNKKTMGWHLIMTKFVNQTWERLRGH